MKPSTPSLRCTRRRFWTAAAASWGGTVGFAAAAAGATGSEPIEQLEEASTAAFLGRAFELRDRAAGLGDQPYGALVVDPSGMIVGQAPSRVVQNHDPTAHAEMEAIRDAARRLGRRDLSGHVIFSSSRPCPMCEAAAYWARLAEMIHGRQGQTAGRPRLCR